MDDKTSGTGGAAQKNWEYLNNTSSEDFINMQFNHGHVVSITVYSVLMIVSATGNLTVLSLLIRRRKAARASRLDFLLMHLAIADLMVTFVMMPLEIAWAATVSWWAGDLSCRVMMFSRTFGLYLSSFVLVCISVDRYYAVLKPLCVTGEARARRALVVAWAGSVLASLPQSFIFHVEQHPQVKGYNQCVTYGMFPTRTYEFMYFMMNMFFMYLLPLFTTVYCYSAVLIEIVHRAKTPHVRRSGVGLLGRARARTLKMTITILIVFFTCWTPYYVYCIWYWIDEESAGAVDQGIQKAMWLFSCTNSCANPIVYGLYNVRSEKNDPRGRSSSCVKIGSRLTYGRTESLEISAATLALARARSASVTPYHVAPNGHAAAAVVMDNNNDIDSPA